MKWYFHRLCYPAASASHLCVKSWQNSGLRCMAIGCSSPQIRLAKAAMPTSPAPFRPLPAARQPRYALTGRLAVFCRSLRSLGKKHARTRPVHAPLHGRGAACPALTLEYTLRHGSQTLQSGQSRVVLAVKISTRQASSSGPLLPADEPEYRPGSKA